MYFEHAICNIVAPSTLQFLPKAQISLCTVCAGLMSNLKYTAEVQDMAVF